MKDGLVGRDGMGRRHVREGERCESAPCFLVLLFWGVACVYEYVRVTSTSRPVPGQLLIECVIYNQ